MDTKEAQDEFYYFQVDEEVAARAAEIEFIMAIVALAQRDAGRDLASFDEETVGGSRFVNSDADHLGLQSSEHLVFLSFQFVGSSLPQMAHLMSVDPWSLIGQRLEKRTLITSSAWDHRRSHHVPY